MQDAGNPQSLEDARVIVGLDLGTTFSGFSYSLRNDPEHNVYMYYEWPGAQDASALPYCKTTTSLYYTSKSGGKLWGLNSWGWPAVLESSNKLELFEHNQEKLQAAYGTQDTHGVDGGISNLSIKSDRRKNGPETDSDGKLVALFKLLMAGDGVDTAGISLPKGLSVDDAIRDFLSEMSKLILEDIKARFGKHIPLSEIQWALTIPAIWDERAKQRMIRCAERAGMVEGLPQSGSACNGGSRHPLLLILEPEAASVFCRTLDTWRLSVGDRFVIVDVGGGTVDLVGQEVTDRNATREVTTSSGGLCGGKFVDDEFFKFASSKIGCLKACLVSRPSSVMAFMRQWQTVKRTFRGMSDEAAIFYVPTGLADEWEKYNEEHNLSIDDTDELVVSPQEMCIVFDPVVSKILALIRAKVQSVSDCKAILMVGGFSSSPYLQQRVRGAFLDMTIIIPPNPGAAVCQGATLFALHPHPVASRIARRTYGIATSRLFQPDDDPSNKYFLDRVFGHERLPVSEDEEPPAGSESYCDHVFSTYVAQGQEIDVNSCVEETVTPMFALQKKITIELLSANGTPRYSTDPCVVKEGQFVLHVDDTSKGRLRQVLVSMYFGRTSVEVRARSLNFGGNNLEKGMVVPVSFMT